MGDVPNIRVLGERQTLDLLHTHSISRYGDGELRVAIGGDAVSQRGGMRLAKELRCILRDDVPGLLVGVPAFDRTPRVTHWAKYRVGKYAPLYVPHRIYASSFITRPDNAPWIDQPDYWQAVRDLWQQKHVVLVVGDAKSITPQLLSGAASVTLVSAPHQHAYAEIDRIENEIGTPSPGLVLLCLGCTATVLASRLHKRGVHALDLGHIGMFMRHAGAFQFRPSDLASGDYRRQLQQKHAVSNWGKHGHSHATEVLALLAQIGGRSVLDYGCGRATLAKALPGIKVNEYDPGILGKDLLPKPADVVVCTDVLEHIEPERLDSVLRHIFLLAGRAAYFVIATQAARESLPDGRNAHLIVKPAEWWLARLRKQGWDNIRSEQRKGFCIWAQK